VPELDSYTEPLMVEIAGRYAYLHVAIVAPSDPVACIFLFHDLAGRSDDFAPLAGHLARMGYRVVMVDFPGRGKSAWLDEPEYTLRMYAEVFMALVSAHGLDDNSALGQGWGAMMALLFENLIQRPFRQMYLCDLPLQWSYAQDPDAQTWATLADLRAPQADSFLSQARARVPDGINGQDDLFALIRERLRQSDDGWSLSLDPAIFVNLHKTRDKVYQIGKAINAARAPVWLLQGAGRQVCPDNLGLTASGLKVRQTRLRRASNISWSCDDILVPTIGAVTLAGQG
jgi:pimeloyl-ACP methyl ester carboxylesterase